MKMAKTIRTAAHVAKFHVGSQTVTPKGTFDADGNLVTFTEDEAKEMQRVAANNRVRVYAFPADESETADRTESEPGTTSTASTPAPTSKRSSAK